MIRRNVLTFLAICLALLPSVAQTVDRIQFCSAEYGDAGDSITIKFNILNEYGDHIQSLRIGELYEKLDIYEDGQKVTSGEYEALTGGVRIPKETTISVLIDRGIKAEGKNQIFESVRNLVNSAPDGCIFLSFFDEKCTKSRVATSKNYNDFKSEFSKAADTKYFFGALYSKLLEFNKNQIAEHSEYEFEPNVSKRAEANPEKAVMFVFVDGSNPADIDDPVPYIGLTDGVKDLSIKPTIYAFYYSSGYTLDEDVEITLDGITGNSGGMNFPRGKYVSTKDNQEILKEIGKAIDNQKYDFAYRYKSVRESYTGNVSYVARWDEYAIGNDAVFAIGTPENPWPMRKESTSDIFMKFCIALLVLSLTILFFFIIMKVVVPFIKSKTFSFKYYKRYQPEFGVQKRICSYCKQPLEAGQMVVTRCKHIMHVHCWKENDYRCAEYGQNCNVGIQDHVDWKNLLTKSSFRDCLHAIIGICAGFFSWIIYECMKRGAFHTLSAGMVNTFLTDESQRSQLFQTCTSKVASFLAIGMLLGFFLSLVFRWNEEYRKKNFEIYMGILGLSLLSSFIGFCAFSFGGIILCMLVSSLGTPVIPWYCSLPAYILFSICTSLSLTIKTSIPIKSAMLGGLFSSVIGFLVLYFTSGFSSSNPWMNMLLNFIIYGGGLGASLVTVRMLAEKYFLDIKNGVKAGTRIPIHKWMNATGGGNKVTIGMTGDCEIQMNWEKSNKVAKEHAVLYIDYTKSVPVIKPLSTNVIYNSRAELPVRKPVPLNNGDTFKIGDTVFQYVETD